VLLPKRELPVLVYPGMTGDEQPYVVHHPPGSISVTSEGPRSVTLHNLSDRTVPFTLVVAGPSFMGVVGGVNAILSAGKALGRFLKGDR